MQKSKIISRAINFNCGNIKTNLYASEMISTIEGDQLNIFHAFTKLKQENENQKRAAVSVPVTEHLLHSDTKKTLFCTSNVSIKRTLV